MAYFCFLLQSWEEKIPLVKSNLERTWLFHEIGRCYLELNRAAEARDYGERSLQCAEEEGDIEWQLNGGVLVAQAEGKQCYYNLSPFSTSRIVYSLQCC